MAPDAARNATPGLGLSLAPADAVVDVGKGRRIRRDGRRPKIQRRHNHAVPGQRRVGRVAVVAVAAHPRAAVQLDHDGKWSLAYRPEKPR